MMDVPVSRLNNRLAVQLPAELPLGLVFVVGQVEDLHQASVTSVESREDRTWFELVDKKYRIRCELSERAAEEVRLGEGIRIRAGGHLVFDTHRADYYLLARDIETVPETAQASTPVLETNGHGVSHEIGRQALTPILADIKRRAESTRLEEANLPYWVQRLAPPEVKKEMALLEPPPAKSPESEPEPAMDEALISALSKAIDSEEEVELTAEMVARLSPRAAREKSSFADNNPYRVPPTAAGTLASEQQNLILPLTLLIFAIILVVFLLAFLIF